MIVFVNSLYPSSIIPNSAQTDNAHEIIPHSAHTGNSLTNLMNAWFPGLFKTRVPQRVLL